MNKIELMQYITEQVMLPAEYPAMNGYKAVRVPNEWEVVEDKINEIASALNVLIEERNAPKNALAKSEVTLTIPTADDVCKMIELCPTSYDVRIENNKIVFSYDGDRKTETGVVCSVDEYGDLSLNYDVSPQSLLAIALFYTYGEGKR